MGTTYVNAMKKNIDSLYFGSLVPVTELNEILQKYHNGLANTVYKASRYEMSSSEIIFNLEDSLQDIQKKNGKVICRTLKVKMRWSMWNIQIWK